MKRLPRILAAGLDKARRRPLAPLCWMEWQAS